MAGEISRYSAGGLGLVASRADRLLTSEMHRRALAQRAEGALIEDRIEGGLYLADRAVSGIAHLHYKISRVAIDAPGLELTLRDIELQVAEAVGGAIRSYVQGR